MLNWSSQTHTGIIRNKKTRIYVAKTSFRMDRYIRKMEDNGHTPLQMAPMIHMSNIMLKECTNDDNSDNESTSGSE